MSTYPPIQDPSLVPFHSLTLGLLSKATAIFIWSIYPIFFIALGYELLPEPIQKFADWLETSGESLRQYNELLFVLSVCVFGLPFMLPLILAFKLWTFGRQLSSKLAGDILRLDKRPPVLYLRPFNVDNAAAPANSPEEGLLTVLRGIGPVVSIGIPGERFQTPGTARLYVRDDEWQSAVISIMDHSAAVVLVMGSSTGIEWELRTILTNYDLRRVLLVFLVTNSVCVEPLKNQLAEFFQSVPKDLASQMVEDYSLSHGHKCGLGFVGAATVTNDRRLQLLELQMEQGTFKGDVNELTGEYHNVNWHRTLEDFLSNIGLAKSQPTAETESS